MIVLAVLSALITLMPVLPVKGASGVTRQDSLLTVSQTVKQGDTIRIRLTPGPVPTAAPLYAEAFGRQAILYGQSDNAFEGLIPVSVTARPGSVSIRVKDATGDVLAEKTVTVVSAHLPVQNIRVSKQTKSLEPLPGEMEAVQSLKNVQTPNRYWDEPFISPTVDCQNSPFGVLRAHNGKLTGDYHKGVDLRSPMGRPVRATASGRVLISQPFRLHGGTVGIDHGQGVSSIYIHLSKRLVNEGNRVKAGELIGKVGATGFASGPHLHWGLYVNGLPVNPNQWVLNVPRCG